jgi:hypothetical protein
MFDGYASNALVITVDPTDHTVSIAKQILEPEPGYWWGGEPYTNFALAGAGTVNACATTLSFSATATVDQGSFGAVSFELGK